MIKPNPPKGGDGKPRVLASFEMPRNGPSKDPKTAGLPPYLDEQRESDCKLPLRIEFDRILCRLRWWWWRCPTSASVPASAAVTQHRPGGLYQRQCWRISMLGYLSQKASVAGNDGRHRGQPNLGLV